MLLEPAGEGGFVIKCVELPVATEGETKWEALANLKEVIEGYIETRSELLGKSKTKAKRELVEITSSPGLLSKDMNEDTTCDYSIGDLACMCAIEVKDAITVGSLRGGSNPQGPCVLDSIREGS